MPWEAEALSHLYQDPYRNSYRYRYQDSHGKETACREVGEKECAAALAANRAQTTESAKAQVAGDSGTSAVPRRLIPTGR